MALQGLSGLAQIFSPSWTFFVILFFITGVGRVSSYVTGFILGRCESLDLHRPSACLPPQFICLLLLFCFCLFNFNKQGLRS